MNNEIGKYVYRKLVYFFENQIPVHFTLSDSGAFKNGIILDLNEEKQTLVLRENVDGDLPFLLEEINPNSIQAFKERGE